MSAIAPKDEINVSASRHYFREPSLERFLVHSKRASTKNFCHTYQILAIKGVGGGLREFVKKGKFVIKIYFSDNVV